MNDDSNPCQAPFFGNIKPRSKTDRSGAVQRILKMTIVSLAGVFVGGLLPPIPGHDYNPGGLGGLVCLSLWFIV
ncbi:MAG: hypothetical protein P8J37_11740 [Fuerstiella sp.]|jgi:hypothetical protein|nr:hypothetical protein [Fuerstiella sp.]